MKCPKCNSKTNLKIHQYDKQYYCMNQNCTYIVIYDYDNNKTSEGYCFFPYYVLNHYARNESLISEHINNENPKYKYDYFKLFKSSNRNFLKRKLDLFVKTKMINI